MGRPACIFACLAPAPLRPGVIAAFAEFVYSFGCRVAVRLRGRKVLSAARLSWV
jgi:hypothetical protein